MEKLFLCCDLDRTLIPNGDQAESVKARPLFSRIAQQNRLILAYVTGRNKAQIRDAIETYDLPVPDYAVGDVGATIYQPGKNWHTLSEWSTYIQNSWHHSGWEDIKESLNTLTFLLLQEPEHQHRHKLSYYTDPGIDKNSLEEEILRRLSPSGVKSNVIFSLDEEKGVALVDILPQKASKRHAIEFIRLQEKLSTDQVMFAGDSGNDLDALTGGIRAVLVKNASEAVRKEAVNQMASQPNPDHLFFARGDFLGMNGNYSAGVLEGLVHFFPETLDWMS
ncbi:HAD-IIB family hydrolase [Desulfobacter vibrioformis]|uniref:HAD-IIB family hydrolase n=1 Tax=Desulfobacter vibrioformis TaxID=34031 RepID=UPI00055828B4|nr:HAD-IIB family hydrolase [Desulfobacter vibrioformis]